MPSFTTGQLAVKLGGQFIGDSDLEPHGFAPADTAKMGDLTFAENESYFLRAENSAASAVLVAGDYGVASRKTLIRVPNARAAFAQVLPLFFPEPVFVPGCHPSSVVAASASVDPSAHIGPGCVVGERTRIGPGVVLQAQVYVGEDCVLGDQVRLFPQVTAIPGPYWGNEFGSTRGPSLGPMALVTCLIKGSTVKCPRWVRSSSRTTWKSGPTSPLIVRHWGPP